MLLCLSALALGAPTDAHAREPAGFVLSPSPADRWIPSMTKSPPSEQWIALCVLDVDTRYEKSSIEGDEAQAFVFGAGAWWWEDDMGTAGEAQLSYSDHDAEVDGVSGSLATWQISVGARAGWRGLTDALVLYGRAGFLWRSDNGDDFTAASDDGLGLYAGCGLELRLGPHLFVSPDVTWNTADVTGGSTQAAVGLSLGWRF